MGSGYWVEGAYRLSKVGRNPLIHNSELAIRGQQCRLSKVAQMLITDLPSQNTTRATLAWNYYFHNGVRFDVSYGRDFTTASSHHTWIMGLTYRFAFL